VSSSADRLSAAQLLMRVEQGGYASRLLSGYGKAGVRTRVLGVLRWQRALDETLAGHLNRPPERLDPEVRAAARLGLFEAAVLGVPPPVATDGAVHLARRLGKGSAAGLVNAVLRRAIPEWSAIAGADPALRHSHPDWIWERWAAAFGDQAAEAAMAAAQRPAAVWVWWIREGARARVSASGLELRRHPWCPDAWSAPGHDADMVRAVGAGEAYVQDPSSQLVARMARAVAPPGARLVDLCAAPGGKTALWRRLGSATRPFAADRHLGRLRLVRPLLDAVGGGLVTVADATRPPLAPMGHALVLVDAPCSGTGTLRRHPELKWRLCSSALGEVAALQARTIDAGLSLLAPAGVLLYTTCSIEPEENEDILTPTPSGFEMVDLSALLPPKTPWLATTAGGVRILPGPDWDGFTMHGLRRTSGRAS
jgi:16S rRNA (cytosine967-C5)-methyltransferase